LAGKSVQANIGSLTVRSGLGAQGGDVTFKTILGWAAVAFVLWWIIEEPGGAAHVVHNIGDFLSTAASGLSHFFASI
jgi:hypothetical protein